MTNSRKNIAPAIGSAASQGIRHPRRLHHQPRVLLIAAIAVIVGTGGVLAGVVLLNLIRLCTNLAYFGR